MKRKALLIGSPGSDLPGVKKDVQRLREFLLSSAGGSWMISEIDILTDPSRIELDRKLEGLGSSDYSFCYFAGHGRHAQERNMTQIAIQPGVLIDVQRLTKAGSTKQTVVIDACREVQREHKKLAMESLLAKATASFAESDARQVFDSHLIKCGPGAVQLYACDLNEYAEEDSSVGGIYTSALVRSGAIWSSGSGPIRVMTVKEAHEASIPNVQRATDGRQNPAAQYPRAQQHFPFSIR